MKTLMRYFLLTVLLTAVACQQPREISVQPTAITTTGETTSMTPTIQPTPTVTAVEAENTAGIEVAEPIFVQEEQPEATLDTRFSEQNYPAKEAIIFHFNQPMNPSSVERPFLLSPFKKGAFIWSENNTQVSFLPETPFQPNLLYTAIFHNNLESEAGNLLAGQMEWRLTIENSPRVLAHLPATDVVTDFNPFIQVSFSHPMDHTSVLDALSIEPERPFTTQWDDNKLTIVLEDSLEFGPSYTISIDETAVAKNGSTIYQPHTFDIQLAEPLRNFSWRHVARVEPELILHWNYPIDIETNPNPFSISPTMQGSWEWLENQRTVYFYPEGDLLPNTEYTVSVDSLFTLDGEALTEVAPIAFTTRGAILSANPNNVNGTRKQSIEVLFDRPMDQASVEAAFSISPPIDGNFYWEDNLFVFLPDEGFFDSDTRYNYEINTSAKSAAGVQILTEAKSYTFSTTVIDYLADFGHGPNVQVIDSEGRRAVQYRSNFAEPIRLNFKLYQFSPDEYASLFATHYLVNWWEHENYLILPDAQAADYTWQSESISSFSEWNHIQETIIPDEVPSGLYVLEIASNQANSQLLLNISQNTLLAKATDLHLTTWLSDGGKNGVPNATVMLIDDSGRNIAETVTSETGVAKFDLRTVSGVPHFIMAIEGNETTITGIDAVWHQGYWWYGRRSQTTLNYTVYGYTDRPIYKPGQTVYYKGIIRQDDDAILSNVPEGTAVTVRIMDSRDNIVRSFQHTVNDFGTLDGAFDIADGAMLGTYQIIFDIDGETHTQNFKVEQYRKPDYEITLSTDKEAYVLGEEVTLSIDANYFFGEPVPNADVTIKQYRLQHVYWWHSESDEEYFWFDEHSMENVNGRLDENGALSITIPARTHFEENHYYGSSLRSNKIGYEVTVNDGSHQTVSSFVMVDIFNQEAGIRINRDRYVFEEGNPIEITTRVTQIDGSPLANRPVTLAIQRYDRSSSNYRTEERFEANTDANGYAIITIDAPLAGYSRLEATSTDLQGKRVSYISGIFVRSNATTSWYRNVDSVIITADKESYQPGETAVLYIESLLDGPALLTVERGSVRREIEVVLTPPFTEVALPILDTDAPNIHVTINAFKPQTITELTENQYASIPDADLVQATANLSVPATQKQLNVSITPEKDSFAPGEEASFVVRVTNFEDIPVSAELSIALVDDAIFALSDELSGPIFDGFYFERDNLIRNYHSYGPLRYLGGGGGGGGGDGFAGANNPRADFQDTVVWLPNLRTDFNGEVRVTIPLPDNLTRWRMTVKATTADTQVGEAIETIVATQPVVIRPLLPNTLTAGDTVALSALLHNYTNNSQSLTVTLGEADSELLSVLGPREQQITLAPNEVRMVGWTVVADEAGWLDLVVTAVAPDGTLADGVQLPLTVKPLAIPNVVTEVGQFNNQLNTTVFMPEDALAMSEVNIELSRSIAGSIINGLEDLTGYPYGCVEQTMSRALPNAVVGRALVRLGIEDPTLEAELPKLINDGVQRLYGFQHDNGAWGWWHDDNGHPYQTAWVLFGLATTANAGYEVDPTVMENAATWLTDNWFEMDLKTRAFAFYSITLAGHGTMAKAEQLHNMHEQLDAFSLAALALSYHHLNAPNEAQAVLNLLDEYAVSENGRTYFPSDNNDGDYSRKTMASTVRNTGLALSAFAQIQPGQPLEAGMVRYLMSQRQSFGWGTTNETAFTIIGLTDHLVASGFSEQSAPVNYTVFINNSPYTLGTLHAGEPATTITIPHSQLQTGDNQIQVTQEGAAQLFYLVNNRTYQAQDSIQAEGSLDVTRTYLNPRDGSEMTLFEAGSLVQVQLQIKTDETINYVILEDQLPAGLEPLNERLNTSSHEGLLFQETRYYWHDYGYNQKEIRGDRVSFFMTEIRPGMRTITYLARVTQTGSVTAMPTEAYAMYDLSMWGRSDTAVLTFIPATEEE